MRIKACFAVCSVLFVILASVLEVHAATCEDACEVSQSCKSYAECAAAHMNCMAACREKEAWEISAQASEKMTQAAGEMVKVLEQLVKTSEQNARLMERLITKIDEGKEEGPAGK